MVLKLDDMGLCAADGRTVIHIPSDDVAADVAELEYLLTHWSRVNRLAEYEIIPEEHSINLLQKFPALKRT